MFHLLLGRARESPAPKLLLVIPSKLDCLKLAKFFRLELKVYCVRLGTKCLDRMDVQQLYPIYWTLRADGKLKIYIFMKRFWTQNVLSWIIITFLIKHPTFFKQMLTWYIIKNSAEALRLLRIHSFDTFEDAEILTWSYVFVKARVQAPLVAELAVFDWDTISCKHNCSKTTLVVVF